jgi:hypothetical protein
MMRLAWYTVEWGWLSMRSFAAAPTTYDGVVRDGDDDE